MTFTQCSYKCNGLGKQLEVKSAMSTVFVSSPNPIQISMNKHLLPDPLSERENLQDKTDPQGCTTEVMSDLFMVLNVQSIKEDTSCLEEEFPAASLPGIHRVDGSMLQP